ncbi:MAG: ferredoxin [Deltaproteobacteria bacterium]|nr:MAG: ferredoxin [Deltaproteobacteria bacterium]
MSGIPFIVSEDCLACGACVEVCPEVFQLNESLGYAQVIHPEGAPVEKIQEAIDICPVRCIYREKEAD